MLVMKNAPVQPVSAVECITIRAEAEQHYARDVHGAVLGAKGLRMISQSFASHPRVIELVDLDQQLWNWMACYPQQPAQQPVDVDALREFDLQGLILAQRLAALLRSQGIEVYYQSLGDSDCASTLVMGPL